MGQNVFLITPGIEESITEEGKVVEPPLAVDTPGQVDHEAVVPGQDPRVEGHGPEGEGAEEVTEELGQAWEVGWHPPSLPTLMVTCNYCPIIWVVG
jgi:hypothetical protein